MTYLEQDDRLDISWHLEDELLIVDVDFWGAHLKNSIILSQTLKKKFCIEVEKNFGSEAVIANVDIPFDALRNVKKVCFNYINVDKCNEVRIESNLGYFADERMRDELFDFDLEFNFDIDELHVFDSDYFFRLVKNTFLYNRQMIAGLDNNHSVVSSPMKIQYHYSSNVYDVLFDYSLCFGDYKCNRDDMLLEFVIDNDILRIVPHLVQKVHDGYVFVPMLCNDTLGEPIVPFYSEHVPQHTYVFSSVLDKINREWYRQCTDMLVCDGEIDKMSLAEDVKKQFLDGRLNYGIRHSSAINYDLFRINEVTSCLVSVEDLNSENNPVHILNTESLHFPKMRKF